MPQKELDNSKVDKNLEKIKHVIIVLSGKGGVGKSTVSANLAVALSNKNHNVGLIDSDFHGPTIPKMLGIENIKPEQNEEGFLPVNVSSKLKVMSIGFFLDQIDSPVIWRGPLKMGAIKQFLGDVKWGELDYLIVDLPPGTGDEPLSVIQLIKKCDGAIIVTTPQDVALVSVRKSINFVKKMNIPIIGIVENMSGFKCPHCGKVSNIFGEGGGKKASKDYNIAFLGDIPIDANIAKNGDEGVAFINKNVNASNNFKKIVKEVEKI